MQERTHNVLPVACKAQQLLIVVVAWCHRCGNDGFGGHATSFPQQHLGFAHADWAHITKGQTDQWCTGMTKNPTSLDASRCLYHGGSKHDRALWQRRVAD